MLPSWVGAKKAPITHQYQIGDSWHTAPGYRLVGGPHYSCVPPAGRVADPAVMAWLHTLDPSLVPMWKHQTYMRPKCFDTFVATHLCLARHVKDPRGVLRVKYVEMPCNDPRPMPNMIERIFEDVNADIVQHHGGPGPELPFDMTVYEEMARARFDIFEANDRRERARAEKRRSEKAREKEVLLSEQEYRRKDLNKFYQKHLDAPGDTLLAYRRYRAKRRAKALEMLRRMGYRPMAQMQGVQ